MRGNLAFGTIGLQVTDPSFNQYSQHPVFVSVYGVCEFGCKTNANT